MIFEYLLYSSLFFCITGICYKCTAWFYKAFPGQINLKGRLKEFFKSFASEFSFKAVGIFLKSGLIDVLCQNMIFKVDRSRWIMHFIMFASFMLLVFMHAMDEIITENIFPGYMSTLNPFFSLRSIFAVMVLAGAVFYFFRRTWAKPIFMKTSKSDLFLITLVIGVIGSGILLEGMKMASITEFSDMVEEFSDLEYDEPEIQALEAYWVKDFALVSPRVSEKSDPQVLAQGLEIHNAYCMECHSSNKSAFTGYAAAKLISPAALFLDRNNAVSILYYVHIIICFTGLALLPFTKIFHMVVTPISLLACAMTGDKNLKPENQLTRELMELDACTHCCTCNHNCSAIMMYEQMQNNYILPSEKIQALKKYRYKKKITPDVAEALFEGLYLCTNCNRCTVDCPSGIRLKALWLNVREIMIRQDMEKPFILSAFSFSRGLNKAVIPEPDYDGPGQRALEKNVDSQEMWEDEIDLGRSDAGHSFHGLLTQTDTFSACFGCQNCSTGCPVVTNYNEPEKELTLMPHKIMYCLGLGFIEKARSSAMIWNCLSCYQCQENCPQQVSVCDILFALKNEAFNQDTGKNQG